MDANSTTDPTPVNTTGHGQPPSESPPPTTLSGWFKENSTKLLIVVALFAVILRYLHPLDLLLAGGGLSLIIFLHELGHFAAAKLCDVHVKTFSIGFGPALPFCQFQYGETMYKVAMIPLGGFVAMVGEGDEEGDVVEGEPDPETAASDPRNFKNKSVLQRMFIISAGVIMNLILGCICFVATYLHGVQELPAIASHVESGSAAWRAGIHSGTEIIKINGRDRPWFDDLKPIVSSTSRGETVQLEIDYEGTKTVLPPIEPLRLEGVLFPQLGIRPPERAALRSFRRDEHPPYMAGSAASTATGPDGGFKPGDTIVAMTDPDEPSHPVTPLRPKPTGLPGEYFDLQTRLIKLTANPATARHPFEVHVRRKGTPEDSAPVSITVTPAVRQDVGLRMRMGAIAAVRVDSPAAKAGIQSLPLPESLVVGTPLADRIVQVDLPEKDGSITRFSTSVTAEGTGTDDKLKLKPLDPLRLPFELEQWADRQPENRNLTITVLRNVDHTEKRIDIPMTWDNTFRYDLSKPTTPGAPVPISGLGLAYHVQAVVDHVIPGSPAAMAGVLPGDRISQARYRAVDHQGEVHTGGWDEIPEHQWAFADFKLQFQAPHSFDLKIVRPGQPETEVTLNAVPDNTWALPDLGLDYAPDTREQKADGLMEALEMGAYRTTRSIRMIYQGLYAMVFGRISVKLMSGPITLARASYFIAGQDVWHLLIWIGLISVNLAVVNFLPIPVLDGGHMVFLIYEWIRGKPAPLGFQIALTWLGLAMVGSLMLFVIGLDVYRLFFM